MISVGVFYEGNRIAGCHLPKASLELKQVESRKKQEKRDKLDLILEILVACTEPVKKTHLLYRTKVNYAQLTRYLSLLLKLEMMKEISEPLEGYIITEKGRITLQLFHTGLGAR